MQTNKQKIGCKYNAGKTKIEFIHTYFNTQPVTYEQVKQYILTHILSHKLESISKEYLTDSDHLLRNLKILRRNKNIGFASQARETVDFVYYVVKSHDNLFDYNSKDAGRQIYNFQQKGRPTSSGLSEMPDFYNVY